jgi:hypothetical protein
MTFQILPAAPGYIALLFRARGHEILAAPIIAWRVPVNPGPGKRRHAEAVTTSPLDSVDLADGDVRAVQAPNGTVTDVAGKFPSLATWRADCESWAAGCTARAVAAELDRIVADRGEER